VEGHVIIRQLNRGSAAAAAQDGGSDAAVITAERAERAEPVQLELSRRTGPDGYQVISVTGELDIATAEQAYSYISEVIDGGQAPVSVDLSGLTFCDASGLGVLARIARHARQAGRQLRLTSARPSLLKIMRITGLDRAFPELRPPARAYTGLSARQAPRDTFLTLRDTHLAPRHRCAATVEDAACWR
jgi:anti-sigma B factor antagonist